MDGLLYLEAVRKKLIIIFSFLLISLPLFAQEVIVNYEPSSQKIFEGEKKTISVALLDFEGDQSTNSITEQLFNYASKDVGFLKNFIVFPEKTIKAQLNLSEVNTSDKKTIQSLRDILGINYVISGKIIDYKNYDFDLIITRLSDQQKIFDCEFRNSKTSLAFADMINFFMNGLIPKYILMAKLQLNTTPPDAVVKIDNNTYSNINEISIAPGLHRIEIQKEGYNTKVDSIRLNPGEIIQTNYNLRMLVGRLKVLTNKVSAKVEIVRNGQIVKTGEVNQLINDVPVGNYQLICTANGYEKYTRAIEIRQNETTDVNAKLVKEFLSIEKIVSTNSDVTNLKFEETDNGININYNLKGDIDDDYDVELYLTLLGQNEEIKLQKVSGDIGEGKFVGTGRRIFWNAKSETGGRYKSFEGILNLNVEKKGGGIGWFVYTIGAALVGGVAAILTLGKKGGGGETQSPIGAPPPRPQ